MAMKAPKIEHVEEPREVGPVNLGRCGTQATALTILLDSLRGEDARAPFELTRTEQVSYRDVLSCWGGQLAREYIDTAIDRSTGASTAVVYELVLGGEAHGGYIVMLFENEEDWIVDAVFYVFA